MVKRIPAALLVLLFTVASSQAGEADLLLLCAPGFPGSSEQAQEVMDSFASAVAAAHREPDVQIRAVYQNTEESCLETVKSSQPRLVLLTAPFLAKHGAALDLVPVGQVLAADGPSEKGLRLVAGKGRISSPADLSGWTVAGVAGYAPDFVREEILAPWGELPEDVEIAFQHRILSNLRKAARGEPVAVLLDEAQAEALPSLPFAGDLEVVWTSPPVAGRTIASLGEPDARALALARALYALKDAEGASEVLTTMGVAGFEPIPSAP